MGRVDGADVAGQRVRAGDRRRGADAAGRDVVAGIGPAVDGDDDRGEQRGAGGAARIGEFARLAACGESEGVCGKQGVDHDPTRLRRAGGVSLGGLVSLAEVLAATGESLGGLLSHASLDAAAGRGGSFPHQQHVSGKGER